MPRVIDLGSRRALLDIASYGRRGPGEKPAMTPVEFASAMRTARGEIAHSGLQSLLKSRKWARPWEYEMLSDPSWERAGYVFQLFSPSAPS